MNLDDFSENAVEVGSERKVKKSMVVDSKSQKAKNAWGSNTGYAEELKKQGLVNMTRCVAVWGGSYVGGEGKREGAREGGREREGGRGREGGREGGGGRGREGGEGEEGGREGREGGREGGRGEGGREGGRGGREREGGRGEGESPYPLPANDLHGQEREEMSTDFHAPFCRAGRSAPLPSSLPSFP